MEVVRGSFFNQRGTSQLALHCAAIYISVKVKHLNKQAIIRLQKGHLFYTRENFSKITRKEPALRNCPSGASLGSAD